jgi:hypothetical protein
MITMVNLESHKGSFCNYGEKFCQEEYCSRCEIYLNQKPLLKRVVSKGIKDYRDLQWALYNVR